MVRFWTGSPCVASEDEQQESLPGGRHEPQELHVYRPPVQSLPRRARVRLCHFRTSMCDQLEEQKQKRQSNQCEPRSGKNCLTKADGCRSSHALVCRRSSDPCLCDYVAVQMWACEGPAVEAVLRELRPRYSKMLCVGPLKEPLEAFTLSAADSRNASRSVLLWVVLLPRAYFPQLWQIFLLFCMQAVLHGGLIADGVLALNPQARSFRAPASCSYLLWLLHPRQTCQKLCSGGD